MLLKAARDGDGELVKVFLDTGADVNYAEEVGETPLYWAARNGHALNVQLLLRSSEVEVNLKDKEGKTPLHWATDMLDKTEPYLDAHGNFLMISEMLIEDPRTDVNVPNSDGTKVIILAASKGWTRVVKALLNRRDLDPTETDDALYWATINARPDIVKILLRRGGFDVNSKTPEGKTALHFAVEKYGTTEPYYDYKAKYLEAAQALIAHPETDINLPDGDGKTVFAKAAANGWTPIVEALLTRQDLQAACDCDSSHSGVFAEAAGKGHSGVTGLLLKHNCSGQRCQSALFLAASKGHPEVVSQLMRSGADPNWTDRTGKSALIAAAEGYGNTPSYYDEKAEYLKVVDLLAGDSDTNVNYVDDDGHTVLLGSAANGWAPVVQLLLKRKDIDVNYGEGKLINFGTVSGTNMTPLYLAARNAKLVVVSLLVARDDVKV